MTCTQQKKKIHQDPSGARQLGAKATSPERAFAFFPCILDLNTCDILYLSVSCSALPVTRQTLSTLALLSGWCAFLLILSCVLCFGVLTVHSIPKEKHLAPISTKKEKIQCSSPNKGMVAMPVVGSRVRHAVPKFTTYQGKLESRPTVTRQHVWFFFGKENNSSRRVILKIELELNNLNSILSRSAVTPVFPYPSYILCLSFSLSVSVFRKHWQSNKNYACTPTLSVRVSQVRYLYASLAICAVCVCGLECFVCTCVV